MAKHVTYDAQTDLKAKKIKHTIQNVFENCKIEPIIKCEDQYYYRNKLEFSFTENRWLTNKEIAVKIKKSKEEELVFIFQGCGIK